MKYTRTDLNKLYLDTTQGNQYPIYLFFGDRYLCMRAAKKLVAELLPDSKNLSEVIKVDGDTENISDTMNKFRTFSLFGTKQVIQVTDSRIFHSKSVGKTIWSNAEKAFSKDDLEKAGSYLSQLASLGGLNAEDDLSDLSASQWKTRLGFPRPSDWQWATKIEIPNNSGEDSNTGSTGIVEETLSSGVPETNHIIIIAETVDKRKKLFKLIEEKGVVIDLNVDKSLSSAAKKEQSAVISALINNTFKDMGKTAPPQVVQMLIDRTGFHPVACVREAEKLCLYTEDASNITAADVETITSKTREDALFELNEAFATRSTNRSITLLASLLKSGIHPLAIVATLRNQIRKLLFFRALQDSQEPTYQRGLQFNSFQNSYLKAIKEKIGKSDFLKGHPFVTFKGFQQAERFSQQELQAALRKLLNAEFNLKGSGVHESLILENFFLSTIV